MDFFDKLTETLADATGTVAEKAREISTAAALRNRIRVLKSEVTKKYAEIGRLYYEEHKNDPDADYASTCNVIHDTLAEIADLELELSDRS